MDDTVKQQFDRVADDYDKQRRALIPCYDDFYGAAVEWTNLAADEPAILDLGAGTGLLSAMLLEKYPKARFTLIDFSADMLAQARRRFAGRPDRVEFIEADYTAYAFDRKFDAVVSSLSIHHLTHEDKQALFRQIKQLLSPGGVFVNADQAAGATPVFDARYSALWERAVDRSGLERKAFEASRKRRLQDRNARLEQQLNWLRDAGFAHADCVYKYNEFTVFVAIAD